MFSCKENQVIKNLEKADTCTSFVQVSAYVFTRVFTYFYTNTRIFLREYSHIFIRILVSFYASIHIFLYEYQRRFTQVFIYSYTNTSVVHKIIYNS